MSACEKCWSDSSGMFGEYALLLAERDPHPCTPEEQAGPDAGTCPECGRKTLHQQTGEPMCGCALAPVITEDDGEVF